METYRIEVDIKNSKGAISTNKKRPKQLAKAVIMFAEAYSVMMKVVEEPEKFTEIDKPIAARLYVDNQRIINFRIQ